MNSHTTSWCVGAVLVAGLAWVAGWGYSERPGSGGGVGDLDLILLTIRDEDEFDANTTLFSDSAVESMIDSTLGPLALWDLTTESMPAEGTFRHRLEFARKSRGSSRVYMVEYTSHEVNPGEFDVELVLGPIQISPRSSPQPLSALPRPTSFARYSSTPTHPPPSGSNSRVVVWDLSCGSTAKGAMQTKTSSKSLC